MDLIYHKFTCSNNDDRLRLIYVCTDQSFFTADGFRYSHAEAGGITDGSWTCYSEGLRLTKPPISKVQRTLGHILKATEGRSSKQSLKDIEYKKLKFEDRIRWQATSLSVLTPSVYEHGQCVERKMVHSEWMDAYDLELTTQESLIICGRKMKRGIFPMSFVLQIPIKVLRTLVNQVIHQLADEGATDEGEDVSVDSDTTLHCRNNNSEAGITDECSLDEISLVGDIIGMVGEEVLGAARPDDVEAEPEEWDSWSVSHFLSEDGKTPLICNGVYDSVKHSRLFNGLRKLLEKRYRRNFLRSFLKYLKAKYTSRKRGRNEKCLNPPEWIRLRGKVKAKKNSGKMWELQRDLEVGKDAVSRAADSTWWSWEAGSSLFFWRWPSRCQTAARDGTKLFVYWDKMPKYMERQRWPSNELERQKIEKKIRKVRARGYIKPGFVKSLTGFFAVPKAGTDIRIVYDATQCGLNEALWAPNFFLPTVDSILRNATYSTWFGDIDLGEMFLNYNLDLKLRAYAGVDLSELDRKIVGKGAPRVLECWNRTLMGFRPSPYVATQMFAWSEEIILGDHLNPSNPFFWDTVIINLPGTEGYDPVMPGVYKWDSRRKVMACFFGTYIDDIRSGGATEEACRAASRRIASRINYLGQQDAPRKRGHPSSKPRAWAGANCIAKEDDGLYVFSTLGKWNKVKKIVHFWLEILNDDITKVGYKELEKDVGFLCHVSRTYPSMIPYLKGFYNTLNGWRADRNEEGWKIGKTAWLELLANDILFDEENDISVPFEKRKRDFMYKNHIEKPTMVKSVPRLKNDLMALKALFHSESPTLRLVRGRRIGASIVGFGDASGTGFGSSWKKGKGISFRFGTWGDDIANESSNLRELQNLVDTLEEMEKQDNGLNGFEVFLFTDNSTAENAFFNGSSKSMKLFELVLRVRKLEMTAGAKIHLCHVSGTRMIAQGADGLSRGNLNVGVMAGKSMLNFVPLHLDALTRSPNLKLWIEDWMGGDKRNIEWLKPNDWFDRGHDLLPGSRERNVDGWDLPSVQPGIFVWSPAPAACLAAVEELRKARHKRVASHHLFVVPRLMQPEWRKQLSKAADLVITLPCGHSAWPREMFEPLTIAFVLPFIKHRPWQLRGSQHILDLGGKLLRMWRDDLSGEGPVLRQLWNLSRELSSMSEKLALTLLRGEEGVGFQNCNTRKRRGREVEKNKIRASFFKRTKR